MSTLKDEVVMLVRRYGCMEVSNMLEEVRKEYVEMCIRDLGAMGYRIVSEEVVRAKREPRAKKVKEALAKEPLAKEPLAKEEVQQEPLAKEATDGYDKKSYKSWQRSKEKERREYMKSNGIELKDVFTKEKLSEWLSEGRTYGYIAREYLGVKQEEVGKFVKENGLTR